jgi:nitrite reductase/ring-hydroxylating ferredoxin subunit
MTTFFARGGPAQVALYDPVHALLSRDAYVSPEVHAAELERVFRRTWMVVGHESQIPKPHDYFVSRLGTDSVILTRDNSGAVHVLLNSCRHKGMRVCRYDEGNTRKFTCPYHAWSYGIDGKLVRAPGQLVGVQEYKAAYDGKLDMVEWGLINARSESYKGLVFATWSEDAPPLAEYLGDMRWYLDWLLDCRDGRPGRSAAVGGVLKWRINCNWKAATENFIGDGLHGAPTHRSVEAVAIGPGGEGTTRHGTTSQKLNAMTDFSFPRWGHGGLAYEPAPGTGEEDFYPTFASPVGPVDVPPVVEEWHRQAARRRAARMRGGMGVTGPICVGGVFPNLAFHTTFPRTIAVFHPIAPGVCEAWRWLLVDADAPKEVKDLARHHFMRYSGPAGMTEQDDLENWTYLTEASRGTQARRFPYNYQARLHRERESEVLKEAVLTDGLGTEGSIRSYYRAWQRHMRADGWKEYLAAADGELANGVRSGAGL